MKCSMLLALVLAFFATDVADARLRNFFRRGRRRFCQQVEKTKETAPAVPATNSSGPQAPGTVTEIPPVPQERSQKANPAFGLLRSLNATEANKKPFVGPPAPITSNTAPATRSTRPFAIVPDTSKKPKIQYFRH